MEKYYSTFDKNGIRTGSYVKSIHGENIPESAISLTTDEWKLYCTGEYLRNPATGQPEKIITEEPILEPSQLREQAYKNNPLITWQNESITVDQANQVYLQYSAEGSPRAEEMQELIVSTKAHIREMYPDEAI